MVAATAIRSIVPSQNTGIETSASEMTRSRLSAARPRYAAAIAPIAIPRISDTALAADVRTPQVAVNRAIEIARILHIQRLIETQLAPDRRERLRVGLRPGH